MLVLVGGSPDLLVREAAQMERVKDRNRPFQRQVSLTTFRANESEHTNTGDLRLCTYQAEAPLILQALFQVAATLFPSTE